MKSRLGNEIQRIVDIDAESFSVKVEFDDGAVIDIPLGHIFDKPKGLAWQSHLGGLAANLRG